MGKFKKILACIDFSEYSQIVMEYSVELAIENTAQVIAYNVINESDYSYYTFASTYIVDAIPMEEYMKKLHDERSKKLKNFVKNNFFENKHLITMKIDRGVPFSCILDAINSEDVDLVVMANKGRGNIAGFLLGSAAEKVFRHSPVPILSIRERSKFSRSK